MRADIKQKFVVLEVTAPWEDRVKEAYELKKARYSEMIGESHTVRLECSTEACGGRLPWLCCKIYCFPHSGSWVLRGRTSVIQLKTCPWQQNEQVNGCG